MKTCGLVEVKLHMFFVYFTKLAVSQTIRSNGRMIPGTAAFLTLSILRYSKENNVSEIGSVSVLR
jgi:hypothetical protein